MAGSNNDNRTINSLDLFQCILAVSSMIAVVLGMAPKTSKEFIENVLDLFPFLILMMQQHSHFYFFGEIRA